MRNDFGKQGRENEGVSHLRIIVIPSPVAAGVPAFSGGDCRASKATVPPKSNPRKTHKGPMNRAGEAFEKAVESANWNWCDSACVAVIILGSSYYLYHFAKWAHLGFRVIGK